MDRCITAEYILRSGFDLPPAQARSASGLGVKKMTHGASEYTVTMPWPIGS